jgi:hypothetical protein
MILKSNPDSTFDPLFDPNPDPELELEKSYFKLLLMLITLIHNYLVENNQNRITYSCF